MPKTSSAAGRAIKIGGDAFQKLAHLQELIAARGWLAVGIDSTRQATLSAVVEQAIAMMADQSRRPIPTAAQR